MKDDGLPMEQIARFTASLNVLIVLFLYNVMINMGFLQRIGKTTVPQFVHTNFIRANGEKFSLKSLQKKNSLMEPKLRWQW